MFLILSNGSIGSYCRRCSDPAAQNLYKEVKRMIVFGILLILAGAGGVIYGVMQNNDGMAQLSSLLQSGSMNPGTIFIIAGAAVALIGLILTIVGATRKR